MVKSSRKSRTQSKVAKRRPSIKGGKLKVRKSSHKSNSKRVKKIARKTLRKNVSKNIKGGNRKKTVRKTLRKKMKGGRVAFPSEYFGGNSKRYFANPSTSYKTRNGLSVGRSHGSGKVPNFLGTGPNLSPGMGGGKRVKKNKKTHRRTKKSKRRFAKK